MNILVSIEENILFFLIGPFFFVSKFSAKQFQYQLLKLGYVQRLTTTGWR